jgi:cytochrome c peroxidase
MSDWEEHLTLIQARASRFDIVECDTCHRPMTEFQDDIGSFRFGSRWASIIDREKLNTLSKNDRKILHHEGGGLIWLLEASCPDCQQGRKRLGE